MSKIISGRILNGVQTPLLAISNDQIGRTLQIGSNWTKIAIGVRFGMSGPTQTNCGFALGMCNGTTNMFKNATTNNFFGLTAPGTATLGSNTYSISFNVTRKVGVTNTSTAVSTMLIGNLDLSGGADGRLHTCIVQLNKSAGNIDFITVVSNNTVSGVTLQSKNDWINAMENDPLIAINAGYGLASTAGFALDEATNGVLDTVNLSWTQTNTLYIADIGICVKR